MARPPSSLVPAARVLHEELLAASAHPPFRFGPLQAPEGADPQMSPCDWCVDTTERIVAQYGAAFHGGHAVQRPLAPDGSSGA